MNPGPINHPPDPAPSSRSRLAEVAALFLRLGFTAFGGPAVHVALIEDEVVHRRKWLDRQHFLDLVAAVNFIPGPNSTELVIHLGHLRAGWPGLIVAGACFILPAMLIILPLGWLYVTYGQIPNVTGPLTGIRACMIAIIAAAMWRFARTGIRDRFTAAIALAAATLGFLTQLDRFRIPQSELIILALAATAGAIRYRHANTPAEESKSDPSPQTHHDGPKTTTPSLYPYPLLLAASTPLGGKLLALFLFFLKVGATLFGSGYVLVSYLQGGLVEGHRWMNARQLTDAIAIGQITPGPLLTTATFIGYLLGHQWGGPFAAVVGGILATIAIFLPAFCFVAMLGPLWPRLRRSRLARGALDGMNAAVVALILVVSVTLAHQAITTLPSALIAAASLLILLLWNLNSTWLILASAAAGWLLTRFAA